MANAVICYCLFRVGLPLTLGVAIATRFNLFSLIYAILLVLLPLLPAPTSSAIKGFTGHYLKSAVVLSFLVCLSHLIFQASLLAYKPYGHFIINCNSTETLFRHIGLNRLDETAPLDIARLVGVDFLVLIVSVIVLSQCKSYQRFFDAKKLAVEKEKRERDEGSDREDRSRRDEGSDFEDYQSAFDEERKKRRREKANAFLNALQDFAVVFFTAAAAIIHPSVTSALYFLSFLGVTLWWACYKKLGFIHAVYRIILLIYSGLHFIILYLYQLPYAQNFLDPNSLYARIFGLKQLTYVDCKNPRAIYFESLSWAIFLNPILVFLLYWSLASATRTWLSRPKSKKSIEELHANVGEPSGSDTSHRKSTRRPHSRKQSTQRLMHDEVDRASVGVKNEKLPLLETDYQLRRRNYKSMKRGSSARKRNDSSMEVDPNGSIIWSSDTYPYGDGSTVTNGKFRRLVAPVITVFGIIARQSYIATLIIMMAWGITYHSWLTFVLLLWSCVLWMVPNSRKACLYGSPALVMYATVLLIIQFIYGLDLTDDELPQTIESVNLAQIGLVKYKWLPVIPLAVKILYTIMFWITLRQHMQERYSEVHRDIGEGIITQPITISFGTSRTSLKPADFQPNGVERQRISSPLIKKIGDFTLQLLTKYWIWVVACMLMVISLGGEDVVLYRVFYMALFLFFILMFQISYKWWRKIMYGFWLTVIVYSMLVLILIYTYQFEYFPDYWENYIGIPIKLQRDIGLQIYDTGTLFVKLLTPTFFLIITIIQLHYFHKDFLRISDIENYEKRKQEEDSNKGKSVRYPKEESSIIIEEDTGEVSPSTSQDDKTLENDEKKTSSEVDEKLEKDKEKSDDEDEKKHLKEENMKELLTRWGKLLTNNCYKIYDHGGNFIFRFLEIHMIKIVLFTVMALATYDVCAIHFLFVFFVVLALPILRLRTILSHCCAVWVSVLLLAKMVYQLSFVDKHGGWETNCTTVENYNYSVGTLPYPFNETVGNGIWMGFKKTTDLADYCKGYIGLILVLTIQAVVKIRQHIYRIEHEEPVSNNGVIFPNITRANADNGLLECIQYFFNYLFYKFGIEFCFVTTVACIGVRLDVYAVISAIWLCSLFLLRRKTLARIWPFYVAYLSIFVPVQYIMAVGIPPGLCINYPWDSIMHPELRDWLYLPDFIYPPNSYKILVSFFELLFVCCQLHVFHIECAPNAELYEGGSNKEIFYENETSNTITDPPSPNPVPDYITYTTSYLDMIKYVIFNLLFWITLAILFQTGTTRVSFFAMGYVIGCFLFLWNGIDFYVKPMRVIQRSWNMLIAYNVAVILIKSVLQVIGCVFLQALHVNFCWLVQLLGIACLKKLQRDNTLDTDINLQFDDQCKVPVDEAGLLWDGICFGFLLIQKRVFGSYYFQHLIVEIRAQQQLASRGAELINERLMKEVREQQAQEKKVVETIKSKMDRIRAKQQKLRDTEIVDPQTHFQGEEFSTVSTPMYSLSLSTHPDGVVLVDPLHQTVQPIQQVVSPSFGQIPSAADSAACTSSLDGYLEPNKMNMDLGFRRHPRGNVLMRSPSEERSEFSPPPYPATGHAHVSLSRVNSGASSLGRALGPHHFVLPPRQRLMSMSSPAPSSHFMSIRSGDYYMFDDVDDEDVDLELKKLVHSEDSEEDESHVNAKERGLNALLSQAMKTNMKQAVEDTNMRSGDISEVSSMKLSRQTSVTSKLPLSQKSSIRRFEPVPEQDRPSPPDNLPALQPAYGADGDLPPDDVPPTASLSDVRPDLGEDEEPPQSLASKIKTGLKFTKVFLESIIISLTAKLNSVSKDYRYVSRKLSAEKKLLKEKYVLSSCGSLTPKAKSSKKLDQSSEDSKRESKESGKPNSEEVALIVEKSSSSKSDELVPLTPDSDQEKEFQSNHPTIVLFLVSVGYAILSKSEIICYVFVVLNQIKSASVLSLPLPLMVFLWGTLSVPRPSKTFWITIVTYTEAVVVMKYLFQFDFFPWNTNMGLNDPFFPPRILGIEKNDHYALYDLLLLLVVFFHRFMMKGMGLWKDTSACSAENLSSAENEEDKISKHEEVLKIEKADQGSLGATDLPTKNSKGEDEGDFNSEEEDIDISESEEKAKFNAKAILDLPKVLLAGAFAYISPFQKFFNQVLHPDFRVTVDVYFLMIVCDLFLFMIVIFGYWAFGANSGDQSVASYFEDNKIPVPFLIMLIIQFALVVVDRALYLRKNILGKLVFQLVLIAFVHMWMFFVLPAISEREFVNTMPLQLWYFTKCIYFLLSAYQIRCGYPTRILGNFLCKKYNLLNFFSFKGFMLVPFLYELRALMDWIWTDTSLSVGNWFKMEDVFQNIFQLKCQRRFEDEYPSPRGAAKTSLIKYGVGGLLLFIIIGILWFPLVLFALGNTVGITNLPFDCTVQVAFGGYEPIFKMSAQQGALATMTPAMYDSMLFAYRADRNAQAFLANYNRKDITVVELSGASTSVWSVSPPSQQGIIDDLLGKYDMTVTVTYQFSRDSGPDGDKTVINENQVILEPNTELRRTLARMLNGTESQTDPKHVQIPNLIPKLLRVPGKGKPRYVAQLMKSTKSFSNLSISLSRGTFHNFTGEKEWWQVNENCKQSDKLFPFLSQKGCSYIQLIAFNDKVFPSELSILSGRGIVGLYTTIVLLLGRLFRSLIAGTSYTIMFDDMPNVDRILQLCLDIYLVRESNELALEEDLFAKLIFLYRSPETLIKWTRYSDRPV